MAKRLLITAVLFISCSFFLYAQEVKINFTEYDLDNGLHVILYPDNTTPIVAVTVTYHVGSKNEKPDRTGFAHFFEHLMFEGSDNIKRGEYFQYVQNAGGELNAYTSFDETVYHEVLPSNQTELGLWLESERMFHLKIDSVGVETQRGVVKEERKERLDNRPYGSLMEQTFAHAYKLHPYKWTPIGSVQYIDRASLSEFMDFYKTFYVPNNAVLSIAGDFEAGKMKDLVSKYFAGIPRGSKSIYRPGIVEPEQQKEVADTVYDNIQLPAVVKAFHIPAQGTDDYYAIDMLTTLLSSGESSRFYKELVDKEQKALYTGSFPFSLEDPGLFLVYCIANMNVNARDLDSSIDREILRVQNELISEHEFTKLRNQVEDDFVKSKNTNLGIATSLANYYLFYKGNTNLINTELERYMKVTREDIKRVADKYLRKSNETLLYYLPKPLGQKGEGK
ncbi:MAG: insulinase family protein [Ignavibacteria bacterium]|jgi:predicted Zn-dependent peptidase|nr:insulinase family protein [Ignavibacteria bacterium]MCU7504803.1 insulinase family protein [Ignavibacteria bacterium]MCU7517689.1 insulinase family protein [Ignavibacteria bacterium]